jgi:VWFA-related protein
MAAVAAGQEPMRVDLRLVEAHVVASAGDLKESDFKLFDNGKEQRIAVFRVSKPLPAGVFSNRSQSTASSATVLLLDTLNTSPARQVYAQKQILALLGSLEMKEPVALYVLGDELKVLQDFTMNREALLKAMAAWRPELSRALLGSQTPTPRRAGRGGAEAGAQRGVEDLREYSMRERANGTIDGFAAIAQRLMGVPGRKKVIWVTGTFPAMFLNEHREWMRALNRADIGIYPVDARGLAGPAPAGLDTLTEIADQTGGRAFYNTNDLSGAVGKAMENGQVTYTLGFYAQSDQPDGQYHELRVKTGRPGVELKYRKGYFDEAIGVADRSAQAKLQSSIGLTAAVVLGRDSKYRVAVMVDFRDLSLEKKDGRWKGAADLAIVSQRADGKTVDVVSKSLTFDMTDEAYAERQREGFTMEQDMPATKDVSRIRVVIVDTSTGAVGSVSTRGVLGQGVQ